MKANRVHQFGPPEVILFEEVERPVPAENEVLVRVKAAGVGPWDAWVRAGKSALPQSLPLTLGADLSGTVVGLGSKVRGFEPGQQVFGVTNARFTGAYAEYAVATATIIAEKPANLSHVQAGAVPVVAVTAWQMVFDLGRVKAGDRVLVHGGGGAVGSLAVQLSTSARARVIGHDVKAAMDYVERLGAEAVDAGSLRFEDGLEPVDVVIDTVGGDTLARSFSVLKPGGVLISSVSQPDQDEARRRGVRAVFMIVNVTTSALTRVAELLDHGNLEVRIGAVLPLSEARRAHEMLEGFRPRAPGKIVLESA